MTNMKSESEPKRRKTDAERNDAAATAAAATDAAPIAPARPAGSIAEGETYLSFVTRPGGDGSTTPIFYASNAVGDALLSTGIVDLAGATLTSMVPLLPVGT